MTFSIAVSTPGTFVTSWSDLKTITRGKSSPLPSLASARWSASYPEAPGIEKSSSHRSATFPAEKAPKAVSRIHTPMTSRRWWTT